MKNPTLVNRDWRRKKISGSLPIELRLADWALALVSSKNNDKNLKEGKKRFRFSTCFRTLMRISLVAIPLQLFMAVPGLGESWEEDAEMSFAAHPGHSWDWAKHANNLLDQEPPEERTGSEEKLSETDSISSRKRLLRPRNLVTWDPRGEIKIISNPGPEIPFVFISYARWHFSTEEDRFRLNKMAAYAAQQEKCSAYWRDELCCAPEDTPEFTGDVNRICDVVRSARRVVVILPDHHVERRLKEWGDRLWTLPEGLLPSNDLLVYSPQDRGLHNLKVQKTRLKKIEMTGRVWEDREDARMAPPTRLLAEHYAKSLTLSRLEQFSMALSALSDRERSTRLFTDADMAYVLSSLLGYRIEPDATDSLFQALARLSLVNDSDRLIERMICMHPKPYKSFRELFKALTEPDVFESRLWDIHPLCQIVGVAKEPNTVIVSNCRAISIRWKGFPELKCVRYQSVRKSIAERSVRAGTWFILTGVFFAIVYTPFFWNSFRTSTENEKGERNWITGVNQSFVFLILSFVSAGLLLSVLAPFAVRELYGGAVLQASPHLIGFEGVMPIDELEHVVFGDCIGRLSYAPSSTTWILDHRERGMRKGREPDWVKTSPSQPSFASPEARAEFRAKNQRLFTLVDTNSLSVSIFAAQRPPTVALLCGAEGGMCRAVLCSWRFRRDCLFRETVVRLPHNSWDSASAPGWLKLSVGTPEDMRDGEEWTSRKLWKMQHVSRDGGPPKDGNGGMESGPLPPTPGPHPSGTISQPSVTVHSVPSPTLGATPITEDAIAPFPTPAPAAHLPRETSPAADSSRSVRFDNGSPRPSPHQRQPSGPQGSSPPPRYSPGSSPPTPDARSPAIHSSSPRTPSQARPSPVPSPRSHYYLPPLPQDRAATPPIDRSLTRSAASVQDAPPTVDISLPFDPAFGELSPALPEPEPSSRPRPASGSVPPRRPVLRQASAEGGGRSGFAAGDQPPTDFEQLEHLYR